MGLPTFPRELSALRRPAAGAVPAVLCWLTVACVAAGPTDSPAGRGPGSTPVAAEAGAVASEAIGPGSGALAQGRTDARGNLGPAPRGTPGSEVRLAVVDHASFRKLTVDPEQLQEDLAIARQRMAAARALGASRYILFTGDLETLLTYDREVEGLGALGAQAFPEGDPWRQRAAQARKALGEAIAAGRAAGLEVWVHTNQFSYPEPIFALARTAIADEAGHVCVDRPATWALYRAKLEELFDALPGLAGLQLTADEAEQSLFGCAPGGAAGEGGEIGAADGSSLARVNRLVAETAAAAQARGLAIEARTWGRLYRLEEEADPAAMFEGLPAYARLSLKVTDGDFHLFSPPSPLLAHVDARAVLELDAWGEHLGFNAFPAWQGRQWEAMLRPALERGVRQLAVRVAWDSQANDLFRRPWGNLVNLDYARALADEPGLDADGFLQAWVAERYGPRSREAALELYRASTGLQTIWLAEGDVELTDHSRLFRPYKGGDTFERVRDRLDRLQAAGGFDERADFAGRRARVAGACAEARRLVGDVAAAGDAPAGWVDELERGAAAACRVAEGVTDQLELLFLRRLRDAGQDATGLDALEDRILAWTAAWEAEDAESFALFEGGAAAALVEVR